jgi:hypothetical protein
MPNPPPETTVRAEVNLRKFVEVAGCEYEITAASHDTMIDTLSVEVVGRAPGGEQTLGQLTVHTSALEHLGPLLAETLTGLAKLHSAAPASEQRRPRRRRTGGPANSHQAWTEDLDTRLRAAWVAADPQHPIAQVIGDLSVALDTDAEAVQAQLGVPSTPDFPGTVIEAISQVMKRTPLAIRSRLERLTLDPDRPGAPSDTSAGAES